MNRPFYFLAAVLVCLLCAPMAEARPRLLQRLFPRLATPSATSKTVVKESVTVTSAAPAAPPAVKDTVVERRLQKVKESKSLEAP